MLVNSAKIKLIASFWTAPELIDWKSIVLIDTKEAGPSSIDGNI